ncbi:MAG: hypothetical protein ACLS69_04270 [Butyricicoccus sp.]
MIDVLVDGAFVDALKDITPLSRLLESKAARLKRRSQAARLGSGQIMVIF